MTAADGARAYIGMTAALALLTPDVTSPVSDKLRNNTLKDIHAT